MIALLGMGLDDLLCWLIVLPALGFVTYRSLILSDDRRALLRRWAFSLILILIIVLMATSLHVVSKPLWLFIPTSILGIIWVPTVLFKAFKPLTDVFDGGTQEVEAKPYYFLAEGKRRKGLYAEAAAEVRKQLELFPGDAEGLMKLATLQAEDMHDLPAAVTTLNELLQQPALPPHNAIAALQTLADWQMKFGRDPAAARAAFERIIQLYPDSSFSHAAEQRIAHLEGVSRTRDFHEKTVFKVPTGERDLGLRRTVSLTESPEAEADTLVAEYVRQLEKYPTDTDTREKLAVLYAEQFERLDLAVSQLEQLAALPHENPQHIAHWLDLLATLHIRHGHDIEAADNALRRILERFPKTACANRALARLATLQGELQTATTATPSKALGAYEKDMGLKSGSPI